MWVHWSLNIRRLDSRQPVRRTDLDYWGQRLLIFLSRKLKIGASFVYERTLRNTSGTLQEAFTPFRELSDTMTGVACTSATNEKLVRFYHV